MALSSAILEADAEYIVKQDLPVAVTVGVTSYTGTRMSVALARESAAEGSRSKYDSSIYLLLSDLSSIPAVDDLITVGGIQYLVIGKNIDDAQDILRLDIAEKFSNV